MYSSPEGGWGRLWYKRSCFLESRNVRYGASSSTLPPAQASSLECCCGGDGSSVHAMGGWFSLSFTTKLRGKEVVAGGEGIVSR